MGTCDLPNIYGSDATFTLGELIDLGYFDWDSETFDWSAQAYSPEQYERVCAAFLARFEYRELSVLPVARWASMLMYRIRYEIAPVCNELYKALDGVNVLADSDEYGKRRTVSSKYPETQLSSNSDYLSDGEDNQYETVKLGRIADTVYDIAEDFRGVDQIFLDKCAVMFSNLITATIND